MDYTTTTYINFYVNYPVSVKVAQMAVLNKTGKITITWEDSAHSYNDSKPVNYDGDYSKVYAKDFEYPVIHYMDDLRRLATPSS